MEHYFTNNPNLKSELRTIDYTYQDLNLTFYSDNGLFSKDKIDFGSRLLVETILKQENKFQHILDVGCGYGFMGITLAKAYNATVTLVDVNKRALHLTEKNIFHNHVDGKVLESNMYTNVTSTYDLIITNPPIRAGKNIVYGILDDALNYLTPNGELWFVIRKDQGAKSTIEHLNSRYLCAVVEKSKGFYIVRAKNR